MDSVHQLLHEQFRLPTARVRGSGAGKLLADTTRAELDRVVDTGLRPGALDIQQPGAPVRGLADARRVDGQTVSTRIRSHAAVLREGRAARLRRAGRRDSSRVCVGVAGPGRRGERSYGLRA